ncbi:porin family protein [Coprobacter tertius]|uniref:PorT family protein n=1 Tax=Coprobacter tertius TaxID=2944915 RepID=A0ABT1MJD0_9BACT|nr:porin family protein [Coprobacter tertius]MCP9611798.1 PorT family protein [Coprobacter tertius]
MNNISKKVFISILLITLGYQITYSQSLLKKELKHWDSYLYVGYTIGGTSPIPLPQEIRKINSYRPGTNLVAGIDFTRWLNINWGITTGLSIGSKGMTINADVKYMNTYLIVGEGDNTGTFSGTFSGKNKTKVNNGYLRIPLLATWQPIEKWIFYGGPYVSFLLDPEFKGSASNGYIRNGGPTGEKINVEHATFDFSDNLRAIDSGVTIGARWNYNRHISAVGYFDWGLVPVFPSNFNGIPYKMYNLYFTLGIAYKL